MYELFAKYLIDFVTTGLWSFLCTLAYILFCTPVAILTYGTMIGYILKRFIRKIKI
ncbi:MAG: hypothetical protein ACI4VF_10140 [Lachnospirales bacterium]